jgi:hypothetical protein
MPVERFGQTAQDRLVGIGRGAVDDELPARHPEDERGTRLEEQLGPARDAGDCGPQRRVPARIHGVLLDRDRQLDEELAQIARKGDALAARLMTPVAQTALQDTRADRSSLKSIVLSSLVVSPVPDANGDPDPGLRRRKRSRERLRCNY